MVTVAIRMTITFKIFCCIFPRILVNIQIYFQGIRLFSNKIYEITRIEILYIEQKNLR